MVQVTRRICRYATGMGVFVCVGFAFFFETILLAKPIGRLLSEMVGAGTGEVVWAATYTLLMYASKCLLLAWLARRGGWRGEQAAVGRVDPPDPRGR